jgi:hypothetical protein
MNKISAKSIQMFVAGALGLSGLQTLVWTPYYIIYSKDSVFIIVSVISVFALLIGMAILLGNVRAVLWAQIYLWVELVSKAVLFTISASHVLSPRGPQFNWWSITDLLAPLILLMLLTWSRSKRLQNEANA